MKKSLIIFSALLLGSVCFGAENVIGKKKTLHACFVSSDSITISALTDGESYKWTLNDTLMAVKDKSFKHKASGPKYNYVCAVTLKSGSISNDTIIVVTDAYPGAPNHKIHEKCANDGPNVLSVTPKMQPEVYDEYYWNPSYSYTKNGVYMGELTDNTIPDVYFPKKIGMDTYVMAIKNGACDTTYATHYVISEACPPDSIYHNVTTCQSEYGYVTLEPETSGLAYKWNDGSTASTLDIGVSEAGTFNYNCQITTSDIEGTEQMEYFTVVVNKSPVFSVEVNKSKATVTVESGTKPYTFSIDGGKEISSEIITGLDSGWHKIVMTDANTCQSADSFYVSVKKPIKPMVYFTPNGDGVNDLWLVENIEYYPEAIIQIFDRYHKLLHTYKASEFEGWDGMYNGHQVQFTDYWYYIQGDDLDKAYSGHFILKR